MLPIGLMWSVVIELPSMASARAALMSHSVDFCSAASRNGGSLMYVESLCQG